MENQETSTSDSSSSPLIPPSLTPSGSQNLDFSKKGEIPVILYDGKRKNQVSMSLNIQLSFTEIIQQCIKILQKSKGDYAIYFPLTGIWPYDARNLHSYLLGDEEDIEMELHKRTAKPKKNLSN